MSWAEARRLPRELAPPVAPEKEEGIGLLLELVFPEMTFLGVTFVPWTVSCMVGAVMEAPAWLLFSQYAFPPAAVFPLRAALSLAAGGGFALLASLD